MSPNREWFGPFDRQLGEANEPTQLCPKTEFSEVFSSHRRKRLEAQVKLSEQKCVRTFTHWLSERFQIRCKSRKLDQSLLERLLRFRIDAKGLHCPPPMTILSFQARSVELSRLVLASP